MDLKTAVRDVLGVREQPGDEWVTRCFAPEHQDSNPSAHVNVSKGVWYCLDKNTRVLTSDLRWIPIGSVFVGQQLVGFDEFSNENHWRSWRIAAVTGKAVVQKPCYQITLEDGTKFIASGDHQWLVATARAGYRWRRTDDLFNRNGNASFVRLTRTWESSTTREAGYAAGAFDGEGSLSTMSRHNGRGRQIWLSFYQADNEMLKEMQLCLDSLGIEYATYPHYQRKSDRREHHKAITTLTVRAKEPVMRALGILHPPRLMSKFDIAELGVIYPIARPRVMSVDPLGVRGVVAVETDVHTFVAEGFASHNCFSCHRGGKVTDLLDGVSISDPDPDETLSELAKALHDPPVATVLPESYLNLFTHEGSADYWLTRGLSQPTITAFRLGHDFLTNQPVYPLRNPDGQLVGVVRRNLQGQPKYAYPPGSKVSDLLFGYDRLDPGYPVVVVEGAVDALAAWDVGIQATATFGSHLSESQRRLLARLNPVSVVFAYDMDAAGSVGVVKAAQALCGSMDVRVAGWSRALGKDLAELSLEDRRKALTYPAPA